VNEKFDWGIFGAIKCLCRQEDKWGSRVEEESTYCRNRAEAVRWGNTGGTRTGYIVHIMLGLEREDIRLLGKGGY